MAEEEIEVTKKPYSKEKIGVTIILVGITAAIFLAIGYWAGTQSPAEEESNITLTSTVTPTVTATATATTSATDETADWKTYTNKEYGFSFKYDTDWRISDSTISTIGGRIDVEPRSRKTEVSLGTETLYFDVINLAKKNQTYNEYIQEGVDAGRYEELKDDELGGIACKSAVSTPIMEHNVFLINNGDYLIEIGQSNETPTTDEGILNAEVSAAIVETFQLIK